MSKLGLNTSIPEALVSMSEGNPGALGILGDLMQKAEAIDPDNPLGGLGYILQLDDLEIYGSRIWMLFKDVCRYDMQEMCGLLRARQLGLLTATVLNLAIDNRGDGIDVADTCRQVKEQLPNFQWAAPEAAHQS